MTKFRTHGSSVPWTKYLLSAIAALYMAACGDQNPAPTAVQPQLSEFEGSVRAQGIAAAVRQAAAQGDRRRGFESDILRLEARNPGIGGIFFDPDQRSLIVLVVDQRADASVAAAVRQFVQGKGLLNRDGEAIYDVPVEVRRGQFAFSQLVAWSQILLPELVDVPQLVSIDADERMNRVTIGVDDLSASSTISEIVAGAFVPADAIQLELRERIRALVAPPTPTSRLSMGSYSLRQRIRATGAGLEIRNGIGGICSHGWSVRDGNEWGFTTAAHCSRWGPTAGITGEPFYQNTVTAGDSIGSVAIKPPWNLTNCQEDDGTPWVGPCTLADVMWVTTSDFSSVGQRVANPTPASWASNTRGTLNFSSWMPVSNLTGESIGQVVATGAYKVGRTTGQTSGTIEGTCEATQVVSTIGTNLHLCMNRLEGASVGQGDSGGPVFGRCCYPSPYTAYAFGNAVGGAPLNVQDPNGDYCENPPVGGCVLVYATVANIDAHLGVTFEYGNGPPPAPAPLNVSIEGPWEVPEHAFEGCIWGANTTGGSGNKSYQWYYDNVPVGTEEWWSGDTGDAGFHSLVVLVTDDTGSDSDQLQVQAIEGLPPFCF